MTSEESKQNAEEPSVKGFLVMFLIGFFVILMGIIFLVAATLSSEGSISFGGFVLIGPFPLVFGGGPGAPWLVLFAIILGVLSLIMFFIMRKRLKDAF
ncbi:MAG: DUF131 domain-containing protein [Candidatus Bathyarchaeia archaeon]